MPTLTTYHCWYMQEGATTAQRIEVLAESQKDALDEARRLCGHISVVKWMLSPWTSTEPT